MKQTAKIFTNGRSQAVRLPKEYRFDAKEVYIRKDPITGDIILSRKPENWDSFFAALKDVDVPDDFLENLRDKRPQPPRDFEKEWLEEG